MGPSKQDTRSWITVGPPIWVSHTLLGRGTVVWRARGPSELVRLPTILKTAWRTINRDPELAIYDKISAILSANGVAYPSTVAQADNGGDVRLDMDRPMSVNALRGFDDMLLPPLHGVSDRILHRLTIRQFGKPLWEYSSVEQLIRAMIGVIEGHKVLSDNGIVHRDISGGNILIEVAPNKDASLSSSDFRADLTCGFLTDFEFASIQPPELRERAVPVEARPLRGGEPPLAGDLNQGRHVYFKTAFEQTPTKTLPGDGLTGTAIFMAQAVLEAVSNGQPIVRTAEHDLESFCWVIIYVVYKHALDDTETLEKIETQNFRNALLDEFRALFAAYSIADLTGRRAKVMAKSADILAGIASLQKYAVHVEKDGRYLEGIILVIWGYLHHFQPPKFLSQQGLPLFQAELTSCIRKQRRATHKIRSPLTTRS
ncbi:hypothetical protein C8T65DRAFT_744929 [Cerioporus squamosus]|nr:hypothetical protein C8T65DRAFT_744929 [Cerioporus squamosus]